MEILNDVVEKFVGFRQQRAQLFNSVIDVEASSALNWKEITWNWLDTLDELAPLATIFMR